eukprot:CAMPEP_0184710120 /NCGR_PEP_ID=MMETSP0314-20130426/1060_1 /TAXON_ID=38298 /ORGANISM="Rhodella maculata, Strain CCMP 736" /LENGTH=57 /DNA_ID=CAMNT_0027171911 /DNA_START=678 /DNA_END=851 /DNA_ORIENTATION=-
MIATPAQKPMKPPHMLLQLHPNPEYLPALRTPQPRPRRRPRRPGSGRGLEERGAPVV